MGIEVEIDGLTFRSNFDSGNLARVEKLVRPPLSSGSGELSAGFGNCDEYELWTSPDCADTEFENGNRTWFHFSIEGGSKGQTVRLHIMNMNRQGKLYSQGMTPVIRVVPGPPGWHRMPDRPSFVLSEASMRLSFSHTFTRDSYSHDRVTTYFAFCYPHSYEDGQRLLENIEARFARARVASGEGEQQEGEAGPDSIYFHRELLCRTIDGRRVDVVTVSSHEGILAAHEPVIEHGFPDGLDSRARQFEGKKYYFLSARIHPGETPSSHVLRGFLEFILDEDDERAVELRRRFVFVLVPMLNPDGVFRGHYRTDQRGVNLNRVYDNPDPHLHPSVFCVKHLLRSIASRHTLQYYVDLHGHAVKRGCFMYGNSLDVVDQIENILYPRLIALHSPHFDFEACNFSEKNMVARDKKDGSSKEGSGRVAMFKDLGLAQSYTLECNYNCGRMMSTVPPAWNDDDGRVTPATPFGPPMFFSEDTFRGIGRALLNAALEMEGANPFTRIPNSEHPTLAEWRRWAESYVRSSLPYRIMPSVTRMPPIIRPDGTRDESAERRSNYGPRRNTIGEGLLASRQNSRAQLDGKGAQGGAAGTAANGTKPPERDAHARILHKRPERLVRSVSDNRMVVGKGVGKSPVNGASASDDAAAAPRPASSSRTPSATSAVGNIIRGVTGKPAAGTKAAPSSSTKPQARRPETNLAGGPLQRHMTGFEGTRPLKKTAATLPAEARSPSRVSHGDWSLAGHHVDPLVKDDPPPKKFVAPAPPRATRPRPPGAPVDAKGAAVRGGKGAKGSTGRRGIAAPPSSSKGRKGAAKSDAKKGATVSEAGVDDSANAAVAEDAVLETAQEEGQGLAGSADEVSAWPVDDNAAGTDESGAEDGDEGAVVSADVTPSDSLSATTLVNPLHSGLESSGQGLDASAGTPKHRSILNMSNSSQKMGSLRGSKPVSGAGTPTAAKSGTSTPMMRSGKTSPVDLNASSGSAHAPAVGKSRTASPGAV